MTKIDTKKPAKTNPWFPALKTETKIIRDKGSIRLGSGCITGEFPAR